MAMYVTLANFTEDGLEDVDELPEHAEKVEELKRSLGGEPKGFFLTFGQYDLVVLSEMPDAEAAAKVQLTSAMEGNVETETLRAFTMDEVRDILEELPE